MTLPRSSEAALIFVPGGLAPPERKIGGGAKPPATNLIHLRRKAAGVWIHLRHEAALIFVPGGLAPPERKIGGGAKPPATNLIHLRREAAGVWIYLRRKAAWGQSRSCKSGDGDHIDLPANANPRMDMKDCETLVLGATMTGLGIMAGGARDALLLERLAMPAPEFTAAFEPGEDWGDQPEAPEACELRDELVERNILEDNRIHVAALAPVMCRRIIEGGWNCRFWTELIGLTRSTDGGYQVTIQDASGQHRCHFRRVVDTTVGSPWRAAGAPSGGLKVAAVRLNALLHHAAPSAGLPSGADWVAGRLASEGYFRFTVGGEQSWPVARVGLLAAWRGAPLAAQGWRIAALATEFNHHLAALPSLDVAGDSLAAPSSAYGNPLAAFAAGVKLGKAWS